MDAPEVPGLRFRRYSGDEDLAAIVEVFNATTAVDGIVRVETVPRLKNDYDNLPNFDPLDDVVLAEVDGRAVGYSHIHWFKETDGTLAASHRERLLPTWRGRGIMRALLAINEGRARELAAAHASGGAKMGTMVCETETYRTSVLEDATFIPERWYYEMLRDLSEPIEVFPLPGGLEVRPVGPGDVRIIHEASWEAFRGSWAFREMTEKDFQRLVRGPHFQPNLWVVAWDGDRVAGSVYCWIDEEENKAFDRLWGYNDDISVTKEYRRRGLAKALTSRSLVVLRDLGMTHATLGVDTQNPADALSLYEALGYGVHKLYIDLVRPLD